MSVVASDLSSAYHAGSSVPFQYSFCLVNIGSQELVMSL